MDGLTMDEDTEVGIYIPRGQLRQAEGQPCITMRVQMREHPEPAEDTVCSICHENDVRHDTPCGHYVHPTCLEPWLAQSDKCPVCRDSLTVVCTAQWTHNGPHLDDPPTIPEYLRRSSVVIRIDGQAAQIHAADPSFDPDDTTDTDDSSNTTGTASAWDDEEDFDQDGWVDSKNHLTINASDNANVTIQIGSRQ